MAIKKRTTRKSSPKKAKTTKKQKIEKIEKKKGNQSSKSVDNRKENGGAREGSGRKKLEERERLNTLKDQAEQFALEEVEVSVIQGGVVKMVKKQRAHALLEVLFSEGLKNKNMTAIREFFDRTRGRARQEIDMSGEIKTADQYTPDDPALRIASEAYAKAIKQSVIDGSNE